MKNCKQFSVNSRPAKVEFVPLLFVNHTVQDKLNSKFFSIHCASIFKTHQNSAHTQYQPSTCGNYQVWCGSPVPSQEQWASFSTCLHVGISGILSSAPSVGTHTRFKHSKDKGGKGKKGKSLIELSSEELNSVINEKQLLFELDAALEEFKEDLVKSVAVRTNVGNLELLTVELEGDTFPLNELAQIHRKSSHLVIIDCSAFPQATKTVFDVIKDSGMNLNPQQEGTKIAVPLPKVTREHREGLASKAKVLCNGCKESLRQVHNNYVRKAKNKEGQVSSDLLFKVTQKIKELLDERTKAADALLAAKQAELLKV
ncbi:Ribosome recycling factor domain [Trinorchestia longiramus]|nr:Ribosome recycling factor domain [Trinorchestia longiramus]